MNGYKTLSPDPGFRVFCLALLWTCLGSFSSADGVVNKPVLPNFGVLNSQTTKISAIKRIQQLYERKDYEQAINVLKNTLAEDAPDPNVYVGRGMLHFKRGNFRAAFSDASSAVDLDPKFAPAYRLRAASDFKVFESLKAKEPQQVAELPEPIRE